VELKKLDTSFYTDNTYIAQALDFDMESQCWIPGKIRGHGVVAISVNELVFAIPVRSRIRHRASFILQVDRINPNIKGMGLDYSKALLIRKASHVSSDVFALKSKAAGKKLVGKFGHISKQFTHYVGKYILAVQSEDKRILNCAEYRFTTLVNYHEELDLPQNYK